MGRGNGIDSKWVRHSIGVAAFACIASLGGAARADVVTQRYDNQRTGLVVDPSITTASFTDGKWQKLASLPVDGAVYAQPLYLEDINVNGQVRDVIYIATARNKLYAFDADTFAQLWSVTNLPPPDTYDNTLLLQFWPCAGLSPTHVGAGLDVDFGIGIQSTPVIDPSEGYMYFTYRAAPTTPQDPTTAKQYVAKVDLATGTVTDNDVTSYLNSQISGLRQRASLLLEDGVIYVAFASRCEERADQYLKTQQAADEPFLYRGSVVAIDQQTLSPVGTFETLPSGPGLEQWGGGIWMASSGLASDSSGAVYFTTGNALPEEVVSPGPGAVSSSFVKLEPQVTYGGGGQVTSVTFANDEAADFFTPWRALWQDTIDLDLGSAGVMIPPGTDQIVSGGKEGILYVLDRDDLGGYDSTHWGGTTGDPIPPCAYPAQGQCDDDAQECYLDNLDSENPENEVRQKFYAASNMDCAEPPMSDWTRWAHIHGTPVYGDINGTDYLYIWPERGQLRAYERDGTGNLMFDTNPWLANATAPDEGMPAGMLTLSKPQASGGGGVLFAALPLEAQITTLRGALLAFDATPQPDGTLRQLWGDYNEEYIHSKFVPPTVAGGKVYHATFSDQVNVYGRVTEEPVASHTTSIAATLHNAGSHSVTAAIVRPDGRISVFGETNDGPWGEITVLGSVGEFPPGAPVAMGRQGSQLDLFAVGTDGQLRIFWTLQTSNPTVWYPSNSGSYPLSASTSMPLGAPIATVQRSGNRLDVYLVDSQGDLHMYSVVGTGSWSSTKVLGTTTPTLPPGAGVAADIQYDWFWSRIAVFVVDDDGEIAVYNVDNSATASNWTRSQIPTDLLPGAHLATGHQTGTFTDKLNVFAIGGRTAELIDPDTLDGSTHFNSVLTNNGALTVASATGFGSWGVQSLKRKSFAPGVPGAPVAAIKQGSNQLDVFYVSENGAIQVYWVTGTGSSWANAEILVHSMPGAPIKAVAQSMSGGYPNQIDLLVPGTDHIYGSFLSLGLWSPAFQAL